VSKSWRRIGTLSGADAGRLAVKVYVCNGCGLWHLAAAPKQCQGCGRMDFTRFDSKGEASRFADLKLRVHAGLIKDLQVHVRYPLYTVDRHMMMVQFGEYVADFVYLDLNSGQIVIEDFKPRAGASRDAKIKLRIMEASGRPVTLVTSKGIV
jgi:hypothetical protein